MVHAISKDGTRIGYEISGSGPLLITIAGATQYRAVDRDGTPSLARLLAPYFTVLIYDRRGRGESGDIAPYAVAREVEDIAALIDANGGKASLFGMSSGAVLALHAAASLGDRITGLVLYEPPVDPAKSSALYQGDHARMAARAAAGEGEEMLVDFLSGMMPPEALAGFRKSPGWPAFAAVGLTLEHDYRVMADARQNDQPPESWQTIEAPVLILDGERSFPFMKAGADWVAAGLRKAQRRTLPDQDHGYDPKIVAPIVEAFLRTS